jgi:histidyl-tRNA synthetase
VITAVKGTRDILPPATSIWNHVDAAAREVFRVYNYQEIRTPIFEETALFVRGVGEDTDVVSKEMYTFEDRDGSSLTLRPEATASVMRAYIEHRLDQIPGVKKYYYIGPMFRRERPQKGRFRQFFQIGAEAIGSESPMVDAEVIELVIEVLRRAGIDGFKLFLNSIGDQNCRPAYIALLKEKLRDVAPQMCGDCQRRAVTNPLRVLDCKVPQDQPIIESLPSIADHLCDPCRTHFASVSPISTLAASNIRWSHAWSAAWITTCGPRLRLRTARSARRIRSSAAAVMTDWRSRSARASPPPASDSPSARIA